MERTSGNVVISGFEYTYDDLSRIAEEKILAGAVKVCYTYDALSRVTGRTVRRLSDNSVVSSESFTYDAAGNVTGSSGSTFAYDTNNRLTAFNGNSVSYDLDGNMLSDGVGSYTYDSANRLLTAYGHTYTYNAEDVRIRDLGPSEDTSFTYDTNGKLSRLLCKTTGSTVTKYVYGRGLIGEETGSAFKTYHFDFRGSTVAVTNASGTVTDTFTYDTYGKLLARTGTSAILFGFNGRDGVITDTNGLIYMRARYYSPDMKRFINADIVPGEISNAITLNRFAYANGNPVSLIDPFGLSVWDWLQDKRNSIKNWLEDDSSDEFDFIKQPLKTIANGVKIAYNSILNVFKQATANGELDWFLKLTLGATKDEKGIYHISQSYWQSCSIVGYNDLYDEAFEVGVGISGYTIQKDKFIITTDKGQYAIWLWWGDYINLGAGAEVGIYKEGPIEGHWLTSTENSMPMSLTLQFKNTNESIFDYHPKEKQWWINAFSPFHQNVYAEDLILTATIDFSEHQDLLEALMASSRSKEWMFDGTKATYNWSKK